MQFFEINDPLYYFFDGTPLAIVLLLRQSRRLKGWIRTDFNIGEL